MRLVVALLVCSGLWSEQAIFASTGDPGAATRQSDNEIEQAGSASPAGTMAGAEEAPENCVPEGDTPERLSDEQLACIGEPYGPLIRELQEADPAADANREAKQRDFRLVHISTEAGMHLPDEPGVACVFDVPKTLTRTDIHFKISHFSKGHWLYKRALRSYARTYNRTLAGHREFPWPDLCRSHSDDSDGWQAFQSLSDYGAGRLSGAPVGNLHMAARTGDVRAIRRLLKKGEDINEIDVWGFTPLSWAVLLGRQAVVSELIAAGADADRHGARGPTPLKLAIYARSLPLVKRLIKSGADVNAESPALEGQVFFGAAARGGFPLLLAIESGQADIVLLLLKNGAEPNIRNGDGQTPLLVALLKGHPDLVAPLIKHGADVRLRSMWGLSAIQRAAGKRYPGAVRLIAAAGGLADARSGAERALWTAALEHGRDRILMDLVGLGAHVHLLKTAERQVLRSHIVNNQHKEVMKLLDLADQRAADLEKAIKHGDTRRIQSLYSGGAELAEGRMRTGLVMAVEARRPQLIAWFLEQGADPMAQLHPANLPWLRSDREPWRPAPEDRIVAKPPFYSGSRGTALTLAFNYGPLEAVQLIVARAKPQKLKVQPWRGSFLFEALPGIRVHRDPRILDLAVELSEEIPKTGIRADDFLTGICFWAEDPEILRSWLERGYRPRQKGDPPLPEPRELIDRHALDTCMGNSVEQALLILRFGADPNQIDSLGGIELMGAIYRVDDSPEWLEVLKELLKRGANPNIPNSDGEIVLDEVRERIRLAAEESQRNRLSAVEHLLLKHGAKTRAQLEQEGVLEPIPEPERAIPVR